MQTKIFDFRFFDVMTYSNPIIFFSHSAKFNEKLNKLINELDCYKIFSELIFNNKNFKIMYKFF